MPCEVGLRNNAQPTAAPQVGTTAEAGELTANKAPGPDDGGKRGRHPVGAGALAAQKRPGSELPGNGRKSTATERRRHEGQVLEETTALSQARAGGAGIPAQELSVGGDFPPDEPLGELP